MRFTLKEIRVEVESELAYLGLSKKEMDVIIYDTYNSINDSLRKDTQKVHN
jgi:hypothetical protein